MNKNTEIKFFILSFLAGLGSYILFAAYRLLHFVPYYHISDIIPILRPEVRPEIEVPLYITGFIWTMIVGIGIFMILRKVKSLTSDEGISLSLRILIFACFWLIFDLTVKQNPNITYLYDILVYILAIILSFILTFFGKYAKRTIRHFENFLDVFSILLTGSVIITSFIILLAHKHDSSIISFFLPYYNTIFNSNFSSFTFILIIFLLAFFTKFWLSQTKFLGTDKNIIFRIFIHTLVISYIFFGETVIPNYIKLGLWPHYQDSHTFINSVNDVYGGKTPYVDALSQYGLMVIYTLCGIFRIIPLSFNNFFLVQYVTTVLAYITIYFTLTRWLGLGMGILCIVLVVQPFMVSAGILRYGWWIAIFAYLVFNKSINTKYKRLLELIFAGYFFFWGFDPGMYALIAYCSYVFVIEYLNLRSKDQGFQVFLKSLLKRYGVIALSCLIWFAVLNIFTYLRAGTWPNWHYFIGTAELFVGGFFMYPQKPFSIYLILVSLYFFAIIYILFQIFRQDVDNLTSNFIRNTGIFSFVTSYAVLQTLYYMGRSTGGNMLPVEPVVFVLVCALLFQIKFFILNNNWSNLTKKVQILFASLGGLIFLILAVYLTISLTTYYHIYQTREKFIPEFDEALNQDEMKASVDYINNYLTGKKPPNRRIPLITDNDSFILLNTKSVSMFEFNKKHYFELQRERTKFGEEVKAVHPEILFVYHYMYSSETVMDVMSHVMNDYHFVKNIGILDIWERNK